MILSEHRQIAAAVSAGDEAAAETTMRAHLRTVFDAIETIARNQVDAFAATGGLNKPA
jgi:DNA-binding GntR family transcriptional regulator